MAHILSHTCKPLVVWFRELNVYRRHLKAEWTQCPTVSKIYGVLLRYALKVVCDIKATILHCSVKRIEDDTLKVTASIQCSNAKVVVIYILASRGSCDMKYKHGPKKGERDCEKPNAYVWPKHCCFFRITLLIWE